ncbi:N-6 DNA methylase, partial [Staphylococcus epidermidis]
EIIGQFTTPEKLAKLLVKMTVKNLNSPILDPCCGTGTIPKQVRSYMQSLDISESNIHNNIWASDKMNMALQITNLALTSAESM